jgi:hypothetical protein
VTNLGERRPYHLGPPPDTESDSSPAWDNKKARSKSEATKSTTRRVISDWPSSAENLPESGQDALDAVIRPKLSIPRGPPLPERGVEENQLKGPLKRTTVECSSGTWILGETVAQGPNAKVKRAVNKATYERVL